MIIVASFDEFVFASMKEEPLKRLLSLQFTENVLQIRHTTSKKCKEDELYTDQQGKVRPLKVSWKNR